MDSWRRWHKEYGWKMLLKEIRAVMVERGRGDMQALVKLGANKPPSWVKAVPRLEHDMKALIHLTQDVNPPKRLVRPKGITMVLSQLITGSWITDNSHQRGISRGSSV